ITLKSDVAFIYDYESIWALNSQPGYEGNDFQDAIRRYYQAFFRAGVNVDMVKPEADITQYKLVLASDLFILPDAIAEIIDEYVKQGGVLLADCRTGVKDENNLCHDRTLPGLLSPALGVEIEEYEALQDVEYEVVGKDMLPGAFTATKYTDWITNMGAEVLADYDQWHMKPFAAVTRNSYGKGYGWYVGTVMKEDAFYDQLIAKLLTDAGIKPVINPPNGVEVSIRQGGGKKLLFLINHTEQTQMVNIPKGKLELLSQKKADRTIELGTYGVAVIRF
ncbi:unnamed protein product, partial [marine sediment metagenome]